MIGRTLSHFRIFAKIGEGGMGVVYRAEDTKLRRQVALKVLPPELVGNEERRLRFLREARAAAAVTHPNIATIYEVDEAGGVVFIAMELVEGQTLRDVIGGRPMAIKDALRIATEMAEGLAEAHKAGVIHRDLKPDNVIVHSNGHPKILDFGLAKLKEERGDVSTSEVSKLETISGEITRAGKVLGTAAYMSPEQARGRPVDSRSDQFSFGTTLYEMATGRVPFRGETSADTLSAILRDEPAPPSEINGEVPLEFERIIGKCLEKDPEERYHDTRDLAVDLRKLRRATESGVVAVRTPSAPLAVLPSSGWTRLIGGATRRAVLLAGLAVLLVASGVATWWFLRPRPGFENGDRVFVADFENATQRPELDTLVRDAFEDRIASSKYLQVIRGEALRELLTKHVGETVSRIDHSMANRIAHEAACVGFLMGRIAAEQGGFNLEVRLYRTGEEEPSIKELQTAASEENLLAAVHQIALRLRQRVGEAPRSVSATMPPTTRSLLAYQAFAIGNGIQDPREKVTLYRQALEHDPEFVNAYTQAAIGYMNIGDQRRMRTFMSEAYQRSSKLPTQTRLRTEILYLDSLYDFEGEIESIKKFQRLYPFEDEGPRGLRWIYTSYYKDYAAAESYAWAAYRINPNGKNFMNLVSTFKALGKAGEIERLMIDYKSKGGSDKEIARAALEASWIRGDWSGVLESVARLEAERQFTRTQATDWRFSVLVMMGRLAEAERLMPGLWKGSKKAHDARAMLGVAFWQARFDVRHNRTPSNLSVELLELLRNDLTRLAWFADYSITTNNGEALAAMIQEHELAERDSRSRYVREQLQFAHGCLALIRGEIEKAREILEPLALDSYAEQYHHKLAMAYEALDLWHEAANEYEKVLKGPYGGSPFSPEKILN